MLNQQMCIDKQLASHFSAGGQHGREGGKSLPLLTKKNRQTDANGQVLPLVWRLQRANGFPQGGVS
jgi:hypothetical protein